jgi:hypothetical protein
VPSIKLADTGEAKDVQKLKRYVHDLFGHLSLSTIYQAIDRIDGGDIIKILKVARGNDGDAHCHDCALNKRNLPPIPKGRTPRPPNIRQVEKIFVDLTGYIKEASVYHGYHDVMGEITDLGFIELVGLAQRTQSLLGLAKIIARLGAWPNDIQIDGESTLNTDQSHAWMTGRGSALTSKVTLVENYNHFRKARIERRWDILKKMARCMLSRARLSTKYWYFAIKMAAVTNNMITLVRDEDGVVVKVEDPNGGSRPNDALGSSLL